MFDFRFIDRATMQYKDVKVPEKEDLIEVRFVDAKNKDKTFTFRREFSESVMPKQEAAVMPLSTAEKLDIITGILYDEFCDWATTKHKDDVDIQCLVDGVSHEASKLPEAFCWSVMISRGDVHRMHLLCYEKADHSVDVDECTYQALGIAQEHGLEQIQLRRHIPIIWNKTKKCYDKCYNGDKCRIRLLYTFDQLWYKTHLREDIMRLKNAFEPINLKDWKRLHIESFISTPDKNDTTGELSWNWKEVAQCGCETERRRRLIETCPDCGTRLIEVYVTSSTETWHNLCGRAGMLTFCPHCQKQLRFYLECMN